MKEGNGSESRDRESGKSDTKEGRRKGRRGNEGGRNVKERRGREGDKREWKECKYERKGTVEGRKREENDKK